MKKLGLLLGLGLGSAAFAHTGVHGTDGFMSGLLHPISGFDHMLAMVGVGILAYVMQQKGLRTIITFLVCMIGAALLGYSGVGMVGIEEGILLSIAVVAVLILFAQKIPTLFIATLVGVFGFFHGFAQGTEFVSGSFVSYIIGFSVATLLLHIAGFTAAYLYSTKLKNARA